MNFREYLTENKDVYLLVKLDHGQKDPVLDRDGNTVVTTASSPAHAMNMIQAKIAKYDPQLIWRIRNNRSVFTVQLYNEYKRNKERNRPPLPEVPPERRRQDPQLTLFNLPPQTPY